MIENVDSNRAGFGSQVRGARVAFSFFRPQITQMGADYGA